MQLRLHVQTTLMRIGPTIHYAQHQNKHQSPYTLHHTDYSSKSGYCSDKRQLASLSLSLWLER